jgi:hypothetical protein
VANRGGGGGGTGQRIADITSGNGGSGVVILRYSQDYLINIGAGLTASTAVSGSDRVTTITAGTGEVTWREA